MPTAITAMKDANSDTAAMTAAIRADNLRKEFGTFVAVKGVSLDVETGS